MSRTTITRVGRDSVWKASLRSLEGHLTQRRITQYREPLPQLPGHREKELTAKRKGGYENEPDTRDDQTAFLVSCDFSGRPYSRDEQRCGSRDEVRRIIVGRHLRHCARPGGKDLCGAWPGDRRGKRDPARGCIAKQRMRHFASQWQSSRRRREKRQHDR